MAEITPDIEDSLTHKVVKDNMLIRKAQTDLTRNEQKLVNYMVSMIKPTDEDFKTYQIRAVDFAKLVGIDIKHIYSDFKEMVKSLEKKSFWFENDEKITRISWIIKPEYIKKSGYISLRLDPDIKKYLIGLKKDFTEYELYNVLSLKTKYAITIYELLKSYQYKSKAEIPIEEFKMHIGVGRDSEDGKDPYKNFGLFRKKILDKALDDINLNTDLDISYKCLDSHKKEMKSLQGRKVYYLKFIVKAKETMETFEVYQKTKERVISTDTDQVPHQLSFDTDNDTGDLYDDTTNQKVN